MKRVLSLIIITLLMTTCFAKNLHKYSVQEVLNIVLENSTLDIRGYTEQELLNLVFDEVNESLRASINGGDATIGGLRLTDATELSIVNDAISITQSAHKLLGESGANDDLNTISGGTAMDILVLYPSAPSSSDITIRNGVGNILTSDGSDYTIPDNGFVLLIYNGTNWLLFSGGGTSFPLSNGEWATWLNSVGDTANVMTLDTDNVIKLGQESEFGLHEFVPNSGYVPALDMQITPDAVAGNPYGYYFSIDSTKVLELNGVPNASGDLDSTWVSSPTYISGKKCGVFKILTAQDTTVITTADTYQHVEGNFYAVLAEDFTDITVNTDEPAMRYDGDIEQWFKIDWSTTISGDSPSVLATLNFSINGTPCAHTYKPVLCSSAGAPYLVSSMAVIHLKKGDWVQFILKTNDAGDEVTFYDFQLTICEFFD